MSTEEIEAEVAKYFKPTGEPVKCVVCGDTEFAGSTVAAEAMGGTEGTDIGCLNCGTVSGHYSFGSYDPSHANHFRDRLIAAERKTFDHSFVVRPKESWTFEETARWSEILTDPARRAEHRQWLFANDVILSNLAANCRGMRITDPAEQDRIAIIVLSKHLRDAHGERAAADLSAVTASTDQP